MAPIYILIVFSAMFIGGTVLTGTAAGAANISAPLVAPLNLTGGLPQLLANTSASGHNTSALKAGAGIIHQTRWRSASVTMSTGLYQKAQCGLMNQVGLSS